MKIHEIEIGGRYTAKVSGQMTVVRVTAIREEPGYGSRRSTTRIDATNEATGRRITLRSAQRLRRAVRGCEFCRQRANRPDDGLTCPYCKSVWNPLDAGRGQS